VAGRRPGAHKLKHGCPRAKAGAPAACVAEAQVERSVIRSGRSASRSRPARARRRRRSAGGACRAAASGARCGAGAAGRRLALPPSAPPRPRAAAAPCRAARSGGRDRLERSTSSRCVWRKPVLVIAPRRRRRPLESSLCTSPRKLAGCPARAKRARSPTSQDSPTAVGVSMAQIARPAPPLRLRDGQRDRMPPHRRWLANVELEHAAARATLLDDRGAVEVLLQRRDQLVAPGAQALACGSAARRRRTSGRCGSH
jgi:hypothetical protein